MQALWMVIGAFFFSTMSVAVKYASAYYGAAELVFYRGMVSVFLLWLLSRAQGVSVATRYPGMHAWRSLVGVTSLGAWFYAIGHLPLATSVTLNYMSSVWIAAFFVGGALLAWRPTSTGARPPLQAPLVLTVLAGFAGVVLMLRPTLAPDQMYPALIGLLSGLFAAFAYMQVVALSRIGEPETRTVFYFALGSAVAGGAAALVEGFSPWNWQSAVWLLPVGLFASLGQLCMTRAYALATTQRSTLVVANLQYSGIVFAAAYGALLFGDTLPLIGWMGMALIIASGIAATILRGRAASDTPAEEH